MMFCGSLCPLRCRLPFGLAHWLLAVMSTRAAVQSAGSGVVGMTLADLVPFHVSLPQVPFVFAGWLVTEGATRRIQRAPPADVRQRTRRRAPPAG
jgi:hypothetical protein